MTGRTGWLKNLRTTSFFIRPHALRAFLTVSMMLLSAGMEYLSAAVLFVLINFLTQSSVVFESAAVIFRLTNAFVLRLPFQPPIVSAAIILLAVFILKSLFSFLASYLTEYFSQIVRTDLQKQLMARYINTECAFFSKSRQGNLSYNITQAPALVSANISLLAQTFSSVLTSLFLLALLYSLSVKITTVLLVLGIFAGSLAKMVSRRIAYQEGKRVTESLNKLNVLINESINCIRVVKSYGLGDWVGKEVDKWTDKFLRSKMRVVGYRYLVTDFSATLLVTLFVIFLVGASRQGHATLNSILPQLSIYIVTLLRLTLLLSDVGKRALDYTHLLPNMDLLHHELTSPETKPEQPGEIAIRRVDRIEFRNVTFNYEEHRVLERVSFLIERNKTVAFVGPSGSGKTTILSLLLKLYPPTEGEILINDISINRIQTASLRKAIAPVFQIPLLFNESIAENVALSEGATIDPIRIETALQLAHCTEFVAKLPNGIYTEIGDMGDRLSVGQKQRIILARAFYRDPDAILLDEPTSALDAHSEKLIIQSIRELAGRKTVILVAHRLTTVQEADVIFVLKEGQIVEQGSHQGLLTARGSYWSLYQHGAPENAPASRT